MAIIGAIIGDIIGSQYEFPDMRPDGLDWEHCELFTGKCEFTDDTVLSIATKFAIDNKISFRSAYFKFGNKFPHCVYGSGFESWLSSKWSKPYNSVGNGSAMRVSYVADKFDTQKEVINYATNSAKCTHNHPEGIKGAVVTVMCSWMAKNKCSKAEIYEYAESEYNEEYDFPVSYSMERLRKEYIWSENCQNTVPAAIRCFLDSQDYESCIRNCLSLPCDMDTMCCIAGGIAESFYGTTTFDNQRIFERFLDKSLLELIKANIK